MHELGILRQVVRIVEDVVEKNQILQIKYITLEVGEFSDIVPQYLKKLFPVAIDSHPVLQKAQLKIFMVPTKGLVIKEIGV